MLPTATAPPWVSARDAGVVMGASGDGWGRAAVLDPPSHAVAKTGQARDVAGGKDVSMESGANGIAALQKGTFTAAVPVFARRGSLVVVERVR